MTCRAYLLQLQDNRQFNPSKIAHSRARQTLGRPAEHPEAQSRIPATHLQHVQQRRLASIIQTEEKKLGMLIEEAKRGEDIVN